MEIKSLRKIAIASSGLGYIRRGIETWAMDLAKALHKTGQNITLIQGGPTENYDNDTACVNRVILNSPSRFSPYVQSLVEKFQRVGGWRYGFGSEYQTEQTLFALRLWKYVRSDFDIVHVQDPWVAALMEYLRRAKLSRPYVILGHGTEESIACLRQFQFLQHLAPCYLNDWEKHKPISQRVFAIPNFVDINQFHPGDRKTARDKWNLPQEDLIILCVAAIKSTHKRIDCLIREFHAFTKNYTLPASLVIAGAREAETDAIISLGRDLLGNKIHFLENVTRDKIPSLYQTADIFALASLHEMMPIALLEAIASGLPIACNNTPTLDWMAGKAGNLNDISNIGALKYQFEKLISPETREVYSKNAKLHAENVFSEQVVIRQYLQMYESIIGEKQGHTFLPSQGSL